MKLWNIPPQYLDDYHLIQDHDNCVTLFNLEDESIPDEFYAYLFLKARIDEDELEERGIDDNVQCHITDDDMPDVLEFEEPDYEDVAADIMLIVNVWETLLRSPYLRSGIDTKIEQLLLQSYEDIYHELVFSLQSKKESYE